MVVNYELHEKPGYSIEEAVNNPREAAIIVGKEYGLIVERLPANLDTLRRYQPEIPRRYYYYKDRVIYERGTETLERLVPEGKLASKVNPFVQLILLAINRSSNKAEGKVWVPLSEIENMMIKVFRVFPDTFKARKTIKKFIEYMHDEGWVTWTKRGKEIVGVGQGIDVLTGDLMVDFKPGYNPFEEKIVEYVQMKGTATRDEIYKYVMAYLAWTKESKTVDNIIKRLIKKKAIQQIDKNLFKYNQPLLPFK